MTQRRAMKTMIVSGAAIAALLLAGCGAPAPTAEEAQAGADAGGDFDVDELIAEVENTQAAEPVIPSAASDWNEIPLADGIYREGAQVTGGQRISILVPAYDELEYKLEMRAGDTIVYSWTAEGLSDPEKLLSEFHGHTERVGDAQGDLMFYRRGRGASESGEMTAPFDGIHGWYLKNETLDDIVVQLDVAGEYSIVPDQTGVVQ